MSVENSVLSSARIFVLFLFREGDVTFRKRGSSACNILCELQGRLAAFPTLVSPFKSGSSHLLEWTLVFLIQKLYSGLRYSSVAKYVLSMHEVLGSSPSTEIKPAHACYSYLPMPRHLKHSMAEVGSHLKRHANQYFYCRS